jgi:hypothetical protein
MFDIESRSSFLDEYDEKQILSEIGKNNEEPIIGNGLFTDHKSVSSV